MKPMDFKTATNFERVGGRFPHAQVSYERGRFPDKSPGIVTRWHPTPDELETLRQGGSVYIAIGTNYLPPIGVEVSADGTPFPDLLSDGNPGAYRHHVSGYEKARANHSGHKGSKLAGTGAAGIAVRSGNSDKDAA